MPTPVAPGPDPWKKLVQAHSSGDIVSGKVTHVNKGGVIVSLDDGLKGFIPMSMLGAGRIKPDHTGDLSFLVGEAVKTKVVSVELQGTRREVVLSERRIAETDALRNLKTGQQVAGTVIKITDFGAFVRLDGDDGLSGLVPKSEVSWGAVITVDSVLSVGQAVSAKVLEVDPERCRLTLSVKQTLVDPLKQTMDQLEWSNGATTLPEILDFSRQMRQQEGVDGVTLTRQAQAKQSAAQGLDVYLIRGEQCDINKFLSLDGDDEPANGVPAGTTCLYTIVARLGVQYQELQVQTQLTRRELKKVLQRAIAAVAQSL